MEYLYFNCYSYILNLGFVTRNPANQKNIFLILWALILSGEPALVAQDSSGLLLLPPWEEISLGCFFLQYMDLHILSF